MRISVQFRPCSSTWAAVWLYYPTDPEPQHSRNGFLLFEIYIHHRSRLHLTFFPESVADLRVSVRGIRRHPGHSPLRRMQEVVVHSGWLGRGCSSIFSLLIFKLNWILER